MRCFSKIFISIFISILTICSSCQHRNSVKFKKESEIIHYSNSIDSLTPIPCILNSEEAIKLALTEFDVTWEFGWYNYHPFKAIKEQNGDWLVIGVNSPRPLIKPTSIKNKAPRGCPYIRISSEGCTALEVGYVSKSGKYKPVKKSNRLKINSGNCLNTASKAILLAEKEFLSNYGSEVLEKRPFVPSLLGDSIWRVTGTSSLDIQMFRERYSVLSYSGIPFIRISTKDCSIINVIHTK
jgi:NTF2 fold immunity protein